jgi:hydrogenase nickel incorporation protein HypA/HybF
MHELSIAAYLLEAVQSQADESGAGRVLAINLVIGDRAGIVDDSLRFSFELLADGTLAEGAQLNTRRTPMRFHCDACAHAYTPLEADFRCPDCGTVGRMTDDGSALLIESIEIETQP